MILYMTYLNCTIQMTEGNKYLVTLTSSWYYLWTDNKIQEIDDLDEAKKWVSDQGFNNIIEIADDCQNQMSYADACRLSISCNSHNGNVSYNNKKGEAKSHDFKSDPKRRKKGKRKRKRKSMSLDEKKPKINVKENYVLV